MALEGGIPVIDMSKSDETGLAQEFYDAFSTIGFATLTNHGIDPAIIEQAFAMSKKFFALPLETKMQSKYQSQESNRGYIPLGAEAFTSSPDKKETFDIGKEGEEGYENQWPTVEGMEDFAPTMKTYFTKFDDLQLRIMKILGKALKLPNEAFLVDRCDEQHENLRLLHYPAVPKEKKEVLDDEKKEDDLIQRCAVHTDYGSVTLLVQHGVSGLRAQQVDGNWVNVDPVPNSIVVNMGDMMQRMTNDVFRATPHQVVELPSHNSMESGVVPERYSIAFFCNVNKSVPLEALETCVSEDKPAKYDVVNAHDYITMRLTQTISA